ncbi:MAG: hypothetical protein KF767_10230 [Bdellovibrionaceae bacterium]|nr:hypothetical protein [Pseudobdellovibrionaceae bacterium]
MAVTMVLLGVIVTAFLHQVVGVSSLTSNARIDTQSSELKADLRMYLRQMGSVRRIVSEFAGSPIDTGKGFEKAALCLKGRGSNCTSLQAESWRQIALEGFTMSGAGDKVSGHLMEYHGINGPCVSKDVYACPWRVSVHSRYLCEKGNSCAGIEFVAQIITKNDGKDQVIYRYNKYWSAYDLGYSEPVDYNSCMQRTDEGLKPKDPIKGVNYQSRAIACGKLPEKVVCTDKEEPIRGTGGGECGDGGDIPKAGTCTIAFAPEAFIISNDRKDMKMSYTTIGQNLSRLQAKCEEKWTAAEGYVGPGQEGNSVYASQVAYLPQKQNGEGDLALLQQDILPGRTEITCTAIMQKQDQTEAGECSASITLIRPLGNGPITFEVGEEKKRQMEQAASVQNEEK